MEIICLSEAGIDMRLRDGDVDRAQQWVADLGKNDRHRTSCGEISNATANTRRRSTGGDKNFCQRLSWFRFCGPRPFGKEKADGHTWILESSSNRVSLKKCCEK